MYDITDEDSFQKVSTCALKMRCITCIVFQTGEMEGVEFVKLCCDVKWTSWENGNVVTRYTSCLQQLYVHVLTPWWLGGVVLYILCLVYVIKQDVWCTVFVQVTRMTIMAVRRKIPTSTPHPTKLFPLPFLPPPILHSLRAWQGWWWWWVVGGGRRGLLLHHSVEN